MKTDGLFTVHSFRIKVSKSQPFYLIPFGDIHRDSPGHATEAWQEFLAHTKAIKAPCLYLGMGDYLDSTSTSERECLGATASSMHETLLNDLNELQAEKVKLLAKELAHMRGRLIGLIGGNHFWRFSHGGTTDTELARLLGCQYLGVSSFIRLYIDCHGRQTSLDIWAHHGAGGSRLPGGSINRVDQMREYAIASVYIMGHDHKKSATPATPRLYLQHNSKNGLTIKSQQQWLIRSGSFLRSYEPGHTSYNVDAARGPCSLGHVELIITPRHLNHRNGGKCINEPAELEIHAVT